MITPGSATGETMDDPSAQVPEAPDSETGEAPDSGPETATFPIDFCGQTPPQPNQVIQVKVVSVDTDNGNFTGVCVPSAQPAARGVKAAVASMQNQ